MNTGDEILAKTRATRVRVLTDVPFSNFSSTSSISPVIDAAPSDLYAKYINRHPKNVYKTNAALLTVSLLINCGTTNPSMTDSTVMMVSAHSPPARTTPREFRIAMMAAMMNVSSPSSLTSTMPSEDTNPSLNPPSPSGTASAPSAVRSSPARSAADKRAASATPHSAHAAKTTATTAARDRALARDIVLARSRGAIIGVVVECRASSSPKSFERARASVVHFNHARGARAPARATARSNSTLLILNKLSSAPSRMTRRSTSGLNADTIARTRSSDQSANPFASATRRTSRAVKYPRPRASRSSYARASASSLGRRAPRASSAFDASVAIASRRARRVVDAPSRRRAVGVGDDASASASASASLDAPRRASAVAIASPSAGRDATATLRRAMPRASLDAPSRARASLDDATRASTSLDRARERGDARDCFKTPEGRYNLERAVSLRRAGGRARGAGAREAYDARNRQRVEVATVEGRRYALVNAGEGVRAMALDEANDAKTAASVTFGGACVTSLAWRAKEEGERCDLLVGLANGEVCGVDLGRWLGEKAKRATATTTRWNADGDGVNASRTTCVRWRTRGDDKENLATGFDFVSLHADGSMYTYDSSKDVVAAKFEALADASALSVAASQVPGSNPSARWHFGRHTLNAAAFSPDCRYLVVVNGAGMCRVLDVELDRPNIVAGFKSYYAGFNAVTWSPCGRYVIAGGESDMLEIWGLYEREVVAWGCGGHRSWITDVAVDERAAGEGHRFLRIASVGEDCRVAFWDWHFPEDDDFGETAARDSNTATLADQASRLSVGAARASRRAPSFVGPDANIVQSAHRDEVERLVPIMTHKLHTSPVTAVRFTAEAALTATLNEIKLWRRPSHPSRYVHDDDHEESDLGFP